MLAAQQANPVDDPDAGYRADFYAEDGLYLTLRGHESWLGGDFDGGTSLVGPDTIFVPEADDGRGYELGFGWSSHASSYAMEFTYTRIGYDGSIGAGDADIEYQAINWNMFRYLRGNEALQPYWLIGFTYPWMDLEDASTDGAVIGDAKLRDGLGVHLGLGLAWWLGPRFALDVRGLYAYEAYDKAEGVRTDSETIDDAVEGPSFGISFGLTWMLGRGGS